MIEVGDWVEINCPEKPWFHGQIAEVTEVWPEQNSYGSVLLALSFSPGYYTTRWYMDQIIEFPESNYAKAVEVLGEDYFG